MHYGKMFAGLTAQSRKSTIALLLLVALFASNCKTQKTSLKQTVKTNASETVVASQTTDSSAVRITDTRIDDHSITCETVSEHTTVTTWSQPDENGQQHPLRTTETQRTTCRGKNNSIQTTVTDSLASTTHSVDEEQTDKREDSQTRIDSKEQTETSTPQWVVWASLGIIAALTIIVLLILKRYHII